MRRFPRFLLVAALLLACGDDGSEAEPSDAGSSDASQSQPDAGHAMNDASVQLDASQSLIDAFVPSHQRDAAGSDGGEVPCIDQQFAQLMLFENVANGGIVEEGTTPGIFDTHIDTTAGGLTATESFVYARFTERGLEKVAISDEDAFYSTDWHIAFRRYVMRLNSGVSGPGNVTGARTAPMTDFAALSSAPTDLPYRAEQYYTASCEFVPDTSGIGAPSTVLSSFWSYAGCLSMTGNVFVLKLPDGRHVKFVVRAYYPLDKQQLCEETKKVPQPTGAGNLRVRWSFLD